MIRRFIESLGFRKDVLAPPTTQARFHLKYHELLIGALSVRDGVWKFEYSDEFRQQAVVRPIVEFPDINRIYLNSDLWQFFASRIPSPERNEIRAILHRENIEEDDAVKLLQRFGRKTITNPFELEVVV